MQAKRAHTAPQLEAAGITRLLGLEVAGETQERPADVLLTRAQDIVTGNTAAASRVALDVRVVCPQAAGHLGVASSQVLGAACKGGNREAMSGCRGCISINDF